jgi:flagella basal body P-ring formation protein FlgA
MVALLLALLAASGATPNAREDLPGEVSESLNRALVIPSGRIVPLRFSPPRGCRTVKANVPRPIAASGRVAVQIIGRGCSGWGWVEIEVWANTSVTTRVVRSGEMLASASTVMERAIRSGQMPFIAPADAIAARSLPMGAVLRPDDVSRTNVSLGDPIKVVFVAGVVAIETQGRRSNCLRSRDCAVLPSGKHVEGHIDETGRLLVEVPR